MLLNLVLVKSRLGQYRILQSTAKKETPMRLKRVCIADAQTDFQDNILYVVMAEDLPLKVPECPHLSLITIGYPPAVYTDTAHCELLCCSVNTDLQQLFGSVLDIFYEFFDLEDDLKDRIIRGCEIRDLEPLALQIFGTPITIYGTYEKILMLAYDPLRPENREYYQAAASQEYIAEDERSVLYKLPEFVDTFKVRGPAFSDMNAYNTHIIYVNIFNDDTYLGRVILENTYRPFTDADYCLLDWFSRFIKILMNRTKPFHFAATRGFENMIRELVISEGSYRNEYKKILAEVGWELSDQYLAVHIALPQTQDREQFLTDGAYYLVELFDSQYILMQPTYLFQLINLTRSDHSYTETLRRLEIFQKNNAMVVSTSSLFSDFTEIPLYIRQASLMSAFALTDRKRKLYEYDMHVRDMLLHQMRANNPPQIYFNRHLQELYTHDKKSGSDLIKTLRCYLKNNLNLTDTSRELYIARTTCLYRIKRISEIAHIDFGDPDTLLYLRLVLSLLQSGSV